MAKTTTGSEYIDIGIDVHLPTLLETRMLIQGGSGSGKSHTCRKVAECIGTKEQQIIIDPEGEFFTLREKFPFVLVNKDGGDIPISVTYAEVIANKLMETRLSAIIDLSEFHLQEREYFVKKFLQALIRMPKELYHSAFVMLDEAQLFCPENGKSESTLAVIDLATLGRKRGLCPIFATQRISRLNKSVAAECFNKLIGKTGMDVDRDRAGKELGFTDRKAILGLRNLKPGEFYAFGPAISDSVELITIKSVITTHQKAGHKMAPNPPTPASIKKILESLKDIPEVAEKELVSKQELQKEVRRLQMEVKTLSASAARDKKGLPAKTDMDIVRAIAAAKKETEACYSPLLKEKDMALKKLQGTLVKLQYGLTELRKLAGDTPLISSVLTPESGNAKKPPVHVATSPNLAVVKENGKNVVLPQPVETYRVARQDEEKVQTNGKLGKAHRCLLTALAMYAPNQISRRKAAFIAGISPTGGHYKNTIGEVRRLGYAVIDGESIGITQAGLSALGDFYPLPNDPDELIAYWSAKLGKGAASLLYVLARHHPEYITRAELGREAGLDAGAGHFKNCLGELRTLDLIDETSDKSVKLSSQLYE